MMYVGFLAALACAAAMIGREEEILPVWSCAVGIVVLAGCFFCGRLRRSRTIFAIGMDDFKHIRVRQKEGGGEGVPQVPGALSRAPAVLPGRASFEIR